MPVQDTQPEDLRYEWVVLWRLYHRDHRTGTLHRLRRTRCFPMSADGTVQSEELFQQLTTAMRDRTGVGGVKREARLRAKPKVANDSRPQPQPNNHAARRALARGAIQRSPTTPDIGSSRAV